MHYIISNNLNEISKIQQHFNTQSEKLEIDVRWIRKMNIVIDEILSNIIKYAYEEENKYKIEVIIEYFNKSKARLIFIDEGKFFNPLNYSHKKAIKNVENLEEGGLGIHLVVNLVNNIEYKRNSDKNHLYVEMIFD